MTTSGKAAAGLARQQRLSQALRENLKRRKAQARGRAQDTQSEPAAEVVEAESKAGDTRLSPQSRSD